MVDIKNIPALLKTSCRFCVWKYEKRNGQKTKMPYNPANGERAKINDLHTFADFKTTLVAYAMGGYDGIGVAVGNGIGAFDILTREALPPAARSWKPRVSAYPTTSKSTPTLIRSGGASVRRGNVRERRD